MSNIAGHQRKSVHFRGGRDECIAGLDGPARRPAAGQQSPALIGDNQVNGKNSSVEATQQILMNPGIEAGFTGSMRHTLDAVTQFSQGDYAQESLVFADLG
jgi:hypothetical protein